MTLRIGFDMDGVLADLATAYAEVERRLFGDATAGAPDSPDANGEGGVDPGEDEADAPETAKDATRRLREERRRRQIVWHAIETTENFWTTLAPLEPDVVRHIAETAARHRWEVFFITQRPETLGETAQRQTQRWLAAQGFDLPSVVVTRGARGKLARALGLDYLVDDTAKNCVDVVADAKARVLLVDRSGDPRVAGNARKLGVAVVASAGKALDVLERATTARGNPTLFSRLAKKVGWTAGGREPEA